MAATLSSVEPGLPALLNNAMPASMHDLAMLTSPFAVVNLAFTYPVIVVAAFQLWQHRPDS